MSLTIGNPITATTRNADRYAVMDVLRGFALFGVMLIIGWVHLLGLVGWDVLHIYGIAAFILSFYRKLPDRALLWIGPGLGLTGRAGASTFVPLVMAVFTAQITVSHFWMKFFAFGPAAVHP